MGALVAISAPPASAAQFTQAPAAEFNHSGAGPFTWRFQSSDPSGANGWTAYKLSTESGWHRCVQDGQATLTNLPDGQYTILIADDVNMNWYGSRGLAFSGSTQPCTSGSTAAPDTAVLQDTIYVDTSAPNVGTPNVATSGQTAQVTVAASDPMSGIASYTWSMGDGVTRTTTSGDVTYSYLNYGTYGGSVTVTDKAGNQRTATFTVTMRQPTSSPAPTSGAPSTQPFGTQPSAAPYLRMSVADAYTYAHRVLRRHLVRVPDGLKSGCLRRSETSYRCIIKFQNRRNRWKGLLDLRNYADSDKVRLAYRFRGSRTKRGCRARCTRSLSWQNY